MSTDTSCKVKSVFDFDFPGLTTLNIFHILISHRSLAELTQEKKKEFSLFNF